MNCVQFFEIFENELQTYNKTNTIRDYYKFARKDPFYYWRKIYFLQRLQYIESHLNNSGSSTLLWDVGCGYGTSSIFLSLKGIRSTGSTLEWYHNMIPERKNFYKNYGNPELFSVKVENIFETNYDSETFDYILVQDTLHHLEPIDEAIQIFYKVLKREGKIIIIEENGSNIIQRMKLYFYRGNNRIVEFYDDNLKRNFLAGNENIRPLKKWKELFDRHNFTISDYQYIRFLPPFMLNKNNFQKFIGTEQKLWKNFHILKEYFFWGLNFSATKNK